MSYAGSGENSDKKNRGKGVLGESLAWCRLLEKVTVEEQRCGDPGQPGSHVTIWELELDSKYCRGPGF